jgi:pyruvate formate lyase activating enzyme
MTEPYEKSKPKAELRGLIFHIIHGSFVDGHGIRTTVFLKGCPLRCLWCCNPEGQQVFAELKVTASKCDGCGRCVPVCPAGAIQIRPEWEKDRVKIDRAKCNNCLKCTEVCYKGALERFGEYYTVDELFEIVKKDEQYYRASGGGVTIGGGELTFQSDFTLAFLKKCRENYIHTAVDTCGQTVNSDGLKILEEADLVLYDIKGLDPEEHFKNTGVSNETIVYNLEHLDALGKDIIIRLPVIPGYTDSDQNLQATAEFLAGLKSIERVDLLAYHEYGRVKYDQLGKPYRIQVKSPTQERMESIKGLFERSGLKVQLGG